MANHKNINRICIIISVVTILIAISYIFFGQALGITAKMADLSYTTKLFDDSTVHTINIEISDSDWYDLQANKAASLISSSVETDPTAFCTYQEYQDGVAVLKEFCALRAESVSGQLDGTIPATTTEQTEQPTTLIDASSIDISAMGTNTVGGGMNMQKTASGDTSATATTAENTKTAETTN